MRPRINPITGLSEEDEQNSLDLGKNSFDSTMNDNMAKKSALKKLGKSFLGFGSQDRKSFSQQMAGIPGAWRGGE